MNKDQLLTELERSRAAFSTLIAPLTPQQMLQPTLPGQWTVKDLLVHLMLWEAELIKLLFQATQGRTPKTILTSTEPDEQINARWYEQHKDRPLAQVLKDFKAIRPQTIRRVQALTDQDLADPSRYKWLNNRPLWKWIVESTIEHEQEHAADLKKWRDQ